MSCPTCSHTMHAVGHGLHHCPRCGTLTGCYADGSAFVPALVARLREFARTAVPYPNLGPQEWHRLGLAEAINRPEARP